MNGASLPRRLVYVVNRRTVVDQTTEEVERLRDSLENNTELKVLSSRIGSLSISTLRGQFADNSEWSADPSRPAVICGTVDMIGSRLLFSGYGIGFKAKPLHAGFLGQDVLLVHDEAHLEPAFQELIETIQKEQHEAEQAGELPWLKFRVMSLSATTRNDAENQSVESDANVLCLTPDDRKHSVVKQRIEAPKIIAFHSIATRDGKGKDRKAGDIEKDLLDKILEQLLSHQDSSRTVLVFLRKVEDVEKIVRKLPKNSTEQLTGTLRGLERDDLVKTPIFQRFLPRSNRDNNVVPAKGTAYLVCTSAGEVGVNISADHLVCDLTTFDSMVQRFGRVNRFGERDDTEISVVHPASFEVKGKTNEFNERRRKTLKLLQQLNGDASPHALEQLDAKARGEAFAPEPTILPATDILFDAWSLTTIRDKMPGRPPVEPYLHGISEWEPPQTQVAWRDEVEIITGDLLDRCVPADVLDDYPLKPHELLRDRSDRVFNHLTNIADRHPESPVWLIDDRGSVDVLLLQELADKNNKNRVNGCTVLLPPSVGGLSNNGTLAGKSDFASKHTPGYDVSFGWLNEDGEWQDWCDDKGTPRRWRGRDGDPDYEAHVKGMALVRTIDTQPNADEFDASEDNEETKSSASGRFWHWYVKPCDADDTTRASAVPITWDHHTRDVVTRTNKIVKSLELPDNLQHALIVAAELHDLGKKRELWQRLIGNPNPTEWYAKPGKPADGPRWQPRRLCPYRHEFGSLLDALDMEQKQFAKFEQIDNELRDLVLHVIAAHHGRARPHFLLDEAYDTAPGSDALAREQVLETPRRFARLQRRYGRWGLAYLESLLRAADWAASAEPYPFEENNS